MLRCIWITATRSSNCNRSCDRALVMQLHQKFSSDCRFYKGCYIFRGVARGEHWVHVLPPFGNQGALLPTPGSTFHVKTTRIAQFSLKFSTFFACGGLLWLILMLLASTGEFFENFRPLDALSSYKMSSPLTSRRRSAECSPLCKNLATSLIEITPLPRPG